MRTTWRQALGGLLGFGMVTTAVTPAQAFSTAADLYIYSVVILAIPDAALATYGVAVAAKGELPSNGWSIAETAFTVPQTIFYGTYYAAYHTKDDDQGPLPLLLLVPSAATAILSTHGIWSTATTRVRPGVLAGASIAVGANAALTTGVIAGALTGQLSGRPIGVTTMALTAPQLAVAGYLDATSPASERAGWIGLTAWSGALFVHGLVSAIHGRGDAAPSRRSTRSARSPLLVPGSLRVGPTIVADGVASAPGLGVSGVLF